MNRVIRYIHLFGCVGLLIYCVVAFVSEYEDIISEAQAVFAFIAIVVTAGSGIYLFAAGRNRQLVRLEGVITENAILQLKLEQEKLKAQAAESANH